MDYSISINSLILEITRRCNMRCDHCLRGDAENIDMDLSIIDEVLDSGVTLVDVTFTGGEPSLYPEAIAYFAEGLIKRDQYINQFYVKTNGKIESLELAIALLKLYSRCQEQDMCVLDVSRDQFHDAKEPDAIYPGLAFFRNDGYHEYKDQGIIMEGLAFENGIGYRCPESSMIKFEDYGEESVSVAMIQIAANGNICGQCDISFDREDEETSGNILTDGLSEILSRAYDSHVSKLETEMVNVPEEIMEEA